jgi:hypothetical protein
MMNPEERYLADNEFRMLVDLLTDFIIKYQYSPSELRLAAMMAVTRYETVYASPLFLKDGNTFTRVDSYHGRQKEDR